MFFFERAKLIFWEVPNNLFRSYETVNQVSMFRSYKEVITMIYYTELGYLILNNCNGFLSTCIPQSVCISMRNLGSFAGIKTGNAQEICIQFKGS